VLPLVCFDLMPRLLTIALSLIAVAYLTARLPGLQKPEKVEGSGVQSLSPEAQRSLAFGYRRVMADYYWLQAIQYYGTQANEAQFYRGLYPILDRATNMDPQFDFAYQFGGECIPYHEGKVGWHNTANVVKLLRKGMASDPERWEVPFLLAYNLYTYAGDYKQAGQYMELAADLAERGQRKDERFPPPTYMRSLGARLLAHGGDLDTAIELTRGAVERAHDEKLKLELEDRWRALELERDLQRLNEALEASRAQGREVRSITDLIASSGVPATPVDPFGDPYELDRTSGQVVSKNQSHFLRLYIHANQALPTEQAVD